jgi:MYXO-CTERM domain-containing protein
MRAGCFSRTISVFTVLLAAILTIAAIPLAAQTADTPAGQSAPARVQDTTDAGYGEWGWVGLIGLLGLAGLMRRDRTYPANRAADRPTERVGRP